MKYASLRFFSVSEGIIFLIGFQVTPELCDTLFPCNEEEEESEKKVEKPEMEITSDKTTVFYIETIECASTRTYSLLVLQCWSMAANENSNSIDNVEIMLVEFVRKFTRRPQWRAHV